MRIGIGYDIHRFEPRDQHRAALPRHPAPRGRRRPLKLGGVLVPSARGLAGHSDADVLLHAIADALFGAIGEPDLGEQFPSSNVRYRNADSQDFVRAAYAKVRKRGLIVGNLDATIIADAPKLMGIKMAMRRRIGELLNIDPSQVSVKAKTCEGFEPKGHGIAAQAVVCLQPVRRGRS